MSPQAWTPQEVVPEGESVRGYNERNERIASPSLLSQVASRSWAWQESDGSTHGRKGLLWLFWKM